MAPLQALADDALTLPFAESFPLGCNLDGADSQWTVLNNNNDGHTYEWTEYFANYGFDGEKGYALMQGNYLSDNDDYLATKPITMKAGKVNISFFYKGGFANPSIEAMDIVFGSAATDLTALPAVKEMREIDNTDWRKTYVEVDVPADGQYRFAFHVVSPKGGSQVCVDEVRIEQGAYVHHCELEAVAAQLPMSGCTLTSAEKIGMTISNTGTKDAESFTAAYRLGDDAEWVEETFTTTIAAGGQQTVLFTTPADLSTANTAYHVSVKASNDDQLYTFNDVTSAYVCNKDAADTPHESTFSSEAPVIDLFWWAGDARQESWKVRNKDYFPNVLVEGPLVSAGYNLKAESYKMSFTGSLGEWGWPDYSTSKLRVTMGRNGTPVDEWTTIATPEGSFITSWDFSFDVEEDGVYSFAIYPVEGTKDIMLSTILLDVIPNDNVAITAVRPQSQPVLLPADQMLTDAVITVGNHGSRSESVTVKAYEGESLLAEAEPVDIAAGESADVKIAFTTDKPIQAGTAFDFRFEASIAAADSRPDDNISTYSFTLTDGEYVLDQLTSFEKSIGSQNGRSGYGIVLDMTGTDVLTGVSVGFAEADTDSPFGISIYQVDDNDVTRLLKSFTPTRKAAEGFQDFEITPMQLEKGSRYFIEIVQTESNKDLKLAYESNPDGVYYMRQEWIYNPEMFDPDLLMTLTGANMAVRPTFAAGKQAVAVDLEALGYELPHQKNLMIEEEPVVVNYRNNGYRNLGEVTFHCLLDGELVGEDVVTVLPYQQLVTARFTADLTAIGKHTLTVYPVVEGDENTADNIITYTVESVPESDPYKLDFEDCVDFSTERMNPRWKSVDRDGGVTGGYLYSYLPVEWPGYDSPAGFIAFNPSATVPASPDFFEGFGGQRFGASFFVQDGIANDDWIISPALELGENPVFRFNAKSQAVNYGEEEYYVLVSATGDDPEDFTEVGGLRYAPEKWETVEVSLKEYAGMTVHVAIRCVSKDKFVFLIDDLEVVKNKETDGIGAISADGLNASVDIYSRVLHAIVENGGETLAGVEICDAAGRLAARTEVAGNRADVSLAQLPAGLYVARVATSAGRSLALKFVIP